MPELDIVIPWLELIPFIVHAKEKFWIQALKKVYLETSERNVSPLSALHNAMMTWLFFLLLHPLIKTVTPCC